MTAYTEAGLLIIIPHTEPETMRQQLIEAMAGAMQMKSDAAEQGHNPFYENILHTLGDLLHAIAAVEKRKLTSKVLEEIINQSPIYSR